MMYFSQSEYYLRCAVVSKQILRKFQCLVDRVENFLLEKHAATCRCDMGSKLSISTRLLLADRYRLVRLQVSIVILTSKKPLVPGVFI